MGLWRQITESEIGHKNSCNVEFNGQKIPPFWSGLGALSLCRGCNQCILDPLTGQSYHVWYKNYLFRMTFQTFYLIHSL